MKPTPPICFASLPPGEQGQFTPIIEASLGALSTYIMSVVSGRAPTLANDLPAPDLMVMCQGGGVFRSVMLKGRRDAEWDFQEVVTKGFSGVQDRIRAVRGQECQAISLSCLSGGTRIDAPDWGSAETTFLQVDDPRVQEVSGGLPSYAAWNLHLSWPDWSDRPVFAGTAAPMILTTDGFVPPLEEVPAQHADAFSERAQAAGVSPEHSAATRATALRYPKGSFFETIYEQWGMHNVRSM